MVSSIKSTLHSLITLAPLKTHQLKFITEPLSGLCWEVLAECGFEELLQPHVRDPYPLIAEKAGSLKGPKVGKVFRHVASGKKYFKTKLNKIQDQGF